MLKGKGNGPIYRDGKFCIYVTDLHDSRCPRDVVCVWAGSADVDLVVINRRDTVNCTLRSYMTDESDTVLFNRRISLKDVLPYPGDKPGADFKPNFRGVEIQLKVEKE